MFVCLLQKSATSACDQSQEEKVTAKRVEKQIEDETTPSRLSNEEHIPKLNNSKEATSIHASQMTSHNLRYYTTPPSRVFTKQFSNATAHAILSPTVNTPENSSSALFKSNNSNNFDETSNYFNETSRLKDV